MATFVIEEYLEALYDMQEDGRPVIAARLAERMGVSAPTMTDTLRRMAHQGFVTVDEARVISLTAKGLQVAEAMVRRHRLSERWLTDVLGIDWASAHREACKLEHAISPEVEEMLAKHLNSPSTCPHGNPIPGSEPTPGGEAVPLDRVAAGDEVTLISISHSVERDPALLDYLQRNGLVPGATFKVEETAVGAGLVILSEGERRISLGMAASAHLRVRIRRPSTSSTA